MNKHRQKKILIATILITLSVLFIYLGLSTKDKKLLLLDNDQLVEINSSEYKLTPIDINDGSKETLDVLTADTGRQTLNERVNTLTYVPTELIANNDYGQYDLFLSGNLGCYKYTSDNNSLTITADLSSSPEENLKCSLRGNENILENQIQPFGKRTVDSQYDFITITYGLNNLINPSGWQKVGNRTYSQVLPLQTTSKYYLTGQLPTDKPIVVEIRMGSEIVFKQVLVRRYDNPIKYLITLPQNNSTSSAELAILIPEEIKPNTLNLNVIPVYEPTVTLVKSKVQLNPPIIDTVKVGKGKYLISLSGLSKSAEKKIFTMAGFGWQIRQQKYPVSDQSVWRVDYVFPDVLLILGAIFFIATIGLGFSQFFKQTLKLARNKYVPVVSHTSKPVGQLFGKIITFLLAVCKLFRVPLLIFFIIGVSSDIFFVKPITYSMILFYWMCWFAVNAGWYFESRISYFFAILFLALCPLLLILGLNVNAEKAALWVLLFLFSGLLVQLFERKIPNQKFTNIESLFVLFKQQVIEIKQKDNNYTNNVYARLEQRTADWQNNFKKLVDNQLTQLYQKSTKLFPIPISHTQAGLEKVTKTIFNYVVYNGLFWLSILIFILIGQMLREIQFYSTFFESNYWNEINKRLLFYLVSLWLTTFLISLPIVLIRKKRRRLILVITLMVLMFGNGYIFSHVRQGFQYSPHILSLTVNQNLNYNEIQVTGRNFNNEPNRGLVLIDGLEQRVVTWTDTNINFIVDPRSSKTGSVNVVNQYDREIRVSNAVQLPIGLTD